MLLTGEKLVDDAPFKKQLLALSSKVVGGEMEGAGLYAAVHAAEGKVHWLVIKGISDWADGRKQATTACVAPTCRLKPVQTGFKTIS